MQQTIHLKRVTSIALLAFSVLVMLSMTMGSASAASSDSARPGSKPTIVLVHGALADSSCWEGVISKLQADGFAVIAAADPLRSLAGDSEYVSGIVRNVQGPVVLVGHSYGGSVITNAASSGDNVKALVYVAAFAPDTGESVLDLTGQFPGSLLPAALAPPIALADGADDLYLQQDQFRAVFAGGVAEKQVRLLAATQRPVTNGAFAGASGTPAWKNIPSWFIYGSADRVIPPAAHAFMAHRAGARDTIVVKDAPHVVMISHPALVADFIEKAAVQTVR